MIANAGGPARDNEDFAFLAWWVLLCQSGARWVELRESNPHIV
jgi:hypothetical protein